MSAIIDHDQPLPRNGYIFISEKAGDRIKVDSLKTAKGRIDQAAKATAEALGVEYTRTSHFTI